MHSDLIESLARVSGLERIPTGTQPSGAEAVIPLTTPPVELRIALQGLVNVDEESKRVQKEIEKITADIDFIRNKLSKETFRAKAPPELVAKEEKREHELLAKRKELESVLARLAQLR
jgi:valyl-tRNA synthetase